MSYFLSRCQDTRLIILQWATVQIQRISPQILGLNLLKCQQIIVNKLDSRIETLHSICNTRILKEKFCFFDGLVCLYLDLTYENLTDC